MNIRLRFTFLSILLCMGFATAWAQPATNQPLAQASTASVTAPAADATPASDVAAVQPLSAGDQAVYYGLAVLAGVLVLIAIAIVFILAVLANAIRARDNKKLFTLQTIWETGVGLLQNKFVVTLIVLFVVIVGSTATVKEARNVGVHQNYAPTQPINFSHKIHAGIYNINCNYCHIGVERGKSATIPGTNICWNCHQGIKEVEGNPAQTAEIQKVIYSHDHNVPIQWVRIHNLPDFVYFNHSQHVKVAGIVCQQCHGPIQTMSVVYQYSPLTMGWCINCHRETAVDVKKNQYYIQVDHAYQGSEQPVTAAMLGGLECARCHY